MQFRFYGVSKWTGKLEGDSTELQDIWEWVDSRGIDRSEPFGVRPVPPWVENLYPHSSTYVRQEIADTFFT